MKTYKLFALIVSLAILTAASADARADLLYLANLRATASATNDAGVVKSFSFPGKELVTLTQEGDGFATASGLALVYDFYAAQLSVANVTNLVTNPFLNFSQVGDSVDSADGVNRRRLMSIHLADDTFVGTAVFVERFTFNDMHVQTGYSLQATFQLILSEDDSASLGADRPTIISGKFTASKELVPKS